MKEQQRKKRMKTKFRGIDLCLVPCVSGQKHLKFVNIIYGAWDVYDINVCTNINIWKSLFPSEIHCPFECFFYIIIIMSILHSFLQMSLIQRTESILGDPVVCPKGKRSKKMLISQEKCSNENDIICQKCHSVTFISS